jgi:phage gpG-like protein
MASFNTGKYGRANDNSAIAISGFRELIYALGSIEDEAEAEARKRVREVGERVALVAAGNAPRRTGELAHSIKTSVGVRGASVYSNVVYGGAQNYGAWTQHGRGPHISRTRASHYMDRAVKETAPWVEQEMDSLLDWAQRKFEEG